MVCPSHVVRGMSLAGGEEPVGSCRGACGKPGKGVFSRCRGKAGHSPSSRDPAGSFSAWELHVWPPGDDAVLLRNGAGTEDSVPINYLNATFR